MEFIDRTGHIFSLNDYKTYPTGYEYDEQPYVFWLSDDYASQLSIDCIYIKPIRFITSEKIEDIEITLKETSVFKLLSSKELHKRLDESSDVFNDLQLTFFTDKADRYVNNSELDSTIKSDLPNNDLKMILSKDDLDIIPNVYANNYFYIDNNKEVVILDESMIYHDYDKDLDYFNNLKIETKLLFLKENCLDFDKLLGVNDRDNNVDSIKACIRKTIYEKYSIIFDINNNEGYYDHTIDVLDLDFNRNKELKEILDNNVDITTFYDIIDQELEKRYKELDFYNPKSYIYVDKSTGEYLIKEKFDRENTNHKEFIVGTNSLKYSIIPFYVVGCANEAASWITNVLIKLTTSNGVQYCPISVGGTFVNEIEELTINSQNMGIKLPKDICRALYNMSFWNDTPDCSLWNQKVKEYLLNYMKLFGERGNFQSAEAALKWFGYGNRIELSALIQTDNQFIDQYILNKFDIQYDVIDEFRYFRNSTLLSLSIPAIVATDNTKTLDFNEDFWGEGKPITENLFNKDLTVKRNNIEFIKPFYDWTFTELGIKLSALKYYYQKYFLPIHLSIHRASITNQYYASTNKLLSSARTLITEYTLFTGFNDTTIEFENSKYVWLSEQCRTVDENWIEDPTYQNELNINGSLEKVEQVFFDIIDNCFTVKFWLVNKKWKQSKDEQVFNCKLLAYQGENLMKEADFSICSKEKKYPLNFIIYPKVLNPNFDINFWLDQEYRLEILCNGSWFTYKFNIKVPELDIEIGKLKYIYDGEMFKQFSRFDGNKPVFNIEMWQPDLVTINNVNFINDLCEHFVSEKRYHITGGLAKFVDEYLDSNSIYYYYFDENGNKTYLSSSNYVLVKENGNYVIKSNKYAKPDKNGNYNDNEAAIINCAKDNCIFVSVYKNIYSFIDLYSVEQFIPRNNKFLNKMYIFDLYERDEYGNNKKVKFDNATQGKNIYKNDIHYESINNETKFGESIIPFLKENENSLKDENLKLEYGPFKFSDNDSQFVRDLYSAFFNVDNGNWDKELQYWEDNEWKTTYIEQSLFDLYIMHDLDYWYAVIISKSTIGDSLYDFDNVIKKYYKSANNEWDNKIYTLELQRSEDKFLINRMEFLSLEGIYHFNPSDMIVARLNNFNSLGFKLKIGSRWSFYPLAVGSQSAQSFESPTNIGIMSIGQTDQQHTNGYYSVQVNYSIDNFVNDVQTRKTRILITDKIPSPEGKIINSPTVRIKPKVMMYLSNYDNTNEKNITTELEYNIRNNNSTFGDSVEQVYDKVMNNKSINNLFIDDYINVRFFVKNENKFNVEYNYTGNDDWYETNKEFDSKNFIFWWNSNDGNWAETETTLLANNWESEYNSEIFGRVETKKIKFHILENDKYYDSDVYNLTFNHTIIDNIYDAEWVHNEKQSIISHNIYDQSIENSESHELDGYYNVKIINHYKKNKVLYSRDGINWFDIDKCLVFYDLDEIKLVDNTLTDNLLYFKNDNDEIKSLRVSIENHSLTNRATLRSCQWPISLSYKVFATTTSGYQCYSHSEFSNSEGILEYNNVLINKTSILSLNITNYGFDQSRSNNRDIILRTQNIKTVKRNGELSNLFISEDKEYSNSASLNITIPFLIDKRIDREIFSGIYNMFNDWENLSDDTNIIEKHLVVDMVQMTKNPKKEETKTYTIIIKQNKALL